MTLFTGPARIRPALALLPQHVCALFALLLCFTAYGPNLLHATDADSRQTPTEKSQKRSYLEQFSYRISQVWNEKSLDIYVPFLEYHNKYIVLERDEDEGFNEFAYGFGFGKSIHDEDGDTHALAIMGFADSLYNFQPYAGYLFLKNWTFDEADNFRAGIGLTVGLTARKTYKGEEMNYFPPLPLALPVIGIEYKNFALQATSLFYGDGGARSILFVWFRMRALEW